jgi:hypothetical protein
MRSIPREDVPVVIDDNGVEVRLRDEDGLSVGFVRLPAGADLRPATIGLPNDLCPCPHWGYIIKGRVRMHTLDGHQDFAAGEAFYWAPGHAPEALEDSEYVDFSPTEQFRPVIEHSPPERVHPRDGTPAAQSSRNTSRMRTHPMAAAIVLGAAIAGLAAAATLRGAGIDVTVLERSDRLTARGECGWSCIGVE